MGYANPLFDLPAAAALLAHPVQKRLALALVFRQLRAEANTRAEDAWLRRDGDMAEFHRALSTYARHVAHLLEQQNPLNAKPNRLAVQPQAGVPGVSRNPLLNLPAAHAILGRGIEDRRVLASLLRDLGGVANAEATNSWGRRKAPMARYWWGVTKHSRRAARLLVRGDRSERSGRPPSSAFDLTALLAGSVPDESLTEQCY